MRMLRCSGQECFVRNTLEAYKLAYLDDAGKYFVLGFSRNGGEGSTPTSMSIMPLEQMMIPTTNPELDSGLETDSEI